MLCIPTNRISDYIEQKLSELKGEKDKYNITAGYFPHLSHLAIEHVGRK